MDRIHHPSAIATPPPVDAHATPGYPTEGNPGGGIEATIMTAYIGHSIIEEVRNVIVAAGITPDKANLTQMLAALRALFGGRAPTVLDAPGATNVTVPDWARWARVRVWGGGGGGGGVSGPAGACVAQGGGGAGYAERTFAVTPGASIVCTVGAGGAGGVGLNNGAPGGTSSAGAFASATGGSGGSTTAGGIQTAGGTGGTGVGGQMNRQGAEAQAGQVGAGLMFCAVGGFAFGGGYGALRVGATAFAGNNGTAPGMGGNGGVGGVADGGAGSNGLIVLEWLA